MSGSVKTSEGPAQPNPPPGDGRRDRWDAHRAERRRAFVAAALRVLAAQGPDLTMDAVAAEAGVTKPVLYRYFADKTALVAALGGYGTEQLFTRLLPAIAGGARTPALDWIRTAVGAYFEVIDENPNLYWLIARHTAGETPGDGDPFRQNREMVAGALTAVIGDYLRALRLDSGAAEPWAQGVTGLVLTTGEWWLQRRSMSRANVVEYVSRLLWSALSGVLAEAGVHADPDRPLPVPRDRPRDAGAAAPDAAPAPMLRLVGDGGTS